MKKQKNNKFWLGSPPWIIIGSVIILLPIFLFWTLENIHRQKETAYRLLLEKGAALIRSFEAGTRTGMMGMMGNRGENFQLQRLLMETAEQPDIAYIMVTDINGNIRAHNERDRIGKSYGRDLDLRALSRSGQLQWRQVSAPDGTNVFEAFSNFLPIRVPALPRLRNIAPNIESQLKLLAENNVKQIIFIGLDMSDIEAARKEDARHTVIMAVILLLIGFGGMSSLFLVHAYRSAKSSLTRIKAFSDNVVENMPIGLLALDADREIASFNQTAEALLQLSSSRLIGETAENILPKQFKDLLDEITVSKRTIDREIEYIRGDGIRTPLDISASLLEGEDGSFLGFIILFRDLTEVRSLKKEIERSQRLASIGRLAAGVAHEIRNPLSSIKGFATYFKERYRTNPEDKKTAEIMVQEVERLNRVIGQLLEFARPVNIQKKPVAIKTLIQHSLKMVERDTADRNIMIHKDISPDLLDVSVDSDSINQVLLNLYLNAIDSMEHGGDLFVDARHCNESGRLKITIKDTGHGIDKKDMANIFDPYFTTKQSGTGLGLAIVHKIIESHHGEVKIESEQGKGTTVTIFLPYQ
ncbi:ATP-binding protein [Deltaproteobacteria bacterium]|nr:ATP-binding protein [Deltaproteobacteria bacterium]